MPSRLYGYIWNIMTAVTVDYRKVFVSRDDFREFYREHRLEKGSSAKVIACFLQQAFGMEALPIDTWVKTFIYFPLGMRPKDIGKTEPRKSEINKLYSSYNRLDKLEKLVWFSSMGNKTNKSEFLDILWCQRYGTDEGSDGPTRGANPLSCSQCILRNECISYQAIKNEKIYVSNTQKELKEQMIKHNLFYGVLTEKLTPRKVHVLEGNNFSERDSHSGLDISVKTKIKAGLYDFDTFVNKI
jgi:hypothetical protein